MAMHFRLRLVESKRVSLLLIYDTHGERGRLLQLLHFGPRNGIMTLRSGVQ